MGKNIAYNLCNSRSLYDKLLLHVTTYKLPPFDIQIVAQVKYTLQLRRSKREKYMTTKMAASENLSASILRTEQKFVISIQIDGSIIYYTFGKKGDKFSTKTQTRYSVIIHLQ